MGVFGGRWEEDGTLCCITCVDEVDPIVVFHHLRPWHDVNVFCCCHCGMKKRKEE
jgi:hypothetical protein